MQILTGDSCATNGAAVDLMNEEASALPESDRLNSLVPQGRCFAHMFTNCGSVLKASCKDARAFQSAFKKLAVSDACKAEFRVVTGVSMPTGSDNRFWSWYERTVGLLDVWNLLPRFVGRCVQQKWMPKASAKLKVILDDPIAKLCCGLQMVLIKLVGHSMVQATYFLEGNGFLAPFVWAEIESIEAMMRSLQHADETDARFKQLVEFAEANSSGLRRLDLIERCRDTWRARLDFCSYWQKNVVAAMDIQVNVFKGLSVLHPVTVSTLAFEEVVARLQLLVQEERRNGQCLRSAGCKGVTNLTKRDCVASFGDYLKQAKEFAPQVVITPFAQRPSLVWSWWWSLQHQQGLNAWFKLASYAVLIQPTSAVVERFFSVLKGHTNAQQTAEMDETLETRAMCLWNPSHMTRLD